MSKLLFVVVLCFNVILIQSQTQCPTAPTHPEDRRNDKESLTIATYNVEWLFLNGKNCPGGGCPWTTHTMAEQHMDAVVTEIATINADILNLAEVQDCNVLNTLNDLLNKKGMNYKPYLLTGTDSATGQNVALLTRVDPVANLMRTDNRASYPITGSKCSSSYSGTSGVSKHYYTHFNVDGLPNPLAIFGIHLLAFPDDDNRCVQREAQATVVSELIVAQALSKGYSVVTLGDFNDFDPKIEDAAGSVPISQVLDIIRDPIADKPGDELINIASYVKDHSQIYSNWYDRNSDCNPNPGEFTLIDHVLISKDLADYVDLGYMDHSYEAICRTLESDHWPVIVKLNTTANIARPPIKTNSGPNAGPNARPNPNPNPNPTNAGPVTEKSPNESNTQSLDNSMMKKITIGIGFLVTVTVGVILLITVKKAAVGKQQQQQQNNYQQQQPLLSQY